MKLESSHKHLDEDHPAVGRLRRLLPNIEVAGGSFAGWLPSPNELSPQDRKKLFRFARVKATSICIDALLQQSGQPAREVLTAASGERLWPEGFAGSISHKGTVVIGALAPRSVAGAIGIDLERYALGDEALAPLVGSLPNDRPEAASIAFAAKEAVFKAHFPTSRDRPDFSDITIKWSLRPAGWVGTANCSGRSYLVQIEHLGSSALRFRCRVIRV